MVATAITEAQALKLFGEDRFISADRVVKAWNKIIRENRARKDILPLSAGKPVIPYTEKTLKKYAKEPGWYIIYDPGLSIAEAREIIGADQSHEPNFHADNRWLTNNLRETWATNKPAAGYYLVKLKGVMPLDNPDKDWAWQEQQIGEMGTSYHRAQTRVIANAMITLYLVTGEKQFTNYSHYGPEADSNWCYMTIRWDDKGIVIDHRSNTECGCDEDDGVQVCVACDPETF